MRIARASAFVPFLLICQAALAGGAAPALVTQREINQYAAGLEQARIAILDETGLRRRAEPLTSFVARISVPLAGEPPAAYRMRITQYATRIGRAAEGAAPLRTPPDLNDADPANRAIWNAASNALRALPEQVARLKTTVHSADPARSADTERVRVDLDRALRELISALNDLRDAVP